jgi:hypothetical protein
VGDLTLIPGPLGVMWRPSGRLTPRLDTGELASYALPSPPRARLWIEVSPRIAGHAFVKLFSHGAQERNGSALLGGGLDALFRNVSQACQALGAQLRYVTAWEMWGAIEALREGRSS